jgi:hypothetical protein
LWERFATTRISEEFEIAAGSVQSVSFAAPAIPGTLSGKWQSRGNGGSDTLSGFTLTDPSDALLDSSFKGSSRSFEVKVSAAGSTHSSSRRRVKQTQRRVLDASSARLVEAGPDPLGSSYTLVCGSARSAAFQSPG